MINYFTCDDYLGAIYLMLNKNIPDYLIECTERSKFILNQVKKGNSEFSKATLADVGLCNTCIDQKTVGIRRYFGTGNTTLRQ